MAGQETQGDVHTIGGADLVVLVALVLQQGAHAAEDIPHQAVLAGTTAAIGLGGLLELFVGGLERLGVGVDPTGDSEGVGAQQVGDFAVFLFRVKVTGDPGQSRHQARLVERAPPSKIKACGVEELGLHVRQEKEPIFILSVHVGSEPGEKENDANDESAVRGRFHLDAAEEVYAICGASLKQKRRPGGWGRLCYTRAAIPAPQFV